MLFRSGKVQSVLNGSAISLVYQPIFDLTRAVVIGFESLARFTTTPMRSPDAWFADAALVGLDVQLEMKVIEQALQSFTSLPSGVFVGFNVSPNIVINGQLDHAFQAVALERILLEINEHVSIREYDVSPRRCVRCATRGCAFRSTIPARASAASGTS